MLKIKFAKFSPSKLVLAGLFIFNLLIVSAPVASAFTGVIAAAPTPSSATTVAWPCDPNNSLTTDQKNSCICKGSPELTVDEISKCSGPCHPIKQTSDPANWTALTKMQEDSCTCDGTPNLSVDQIAACQNCQRGSGGCLKNNVIIKDIQKFVNFLSALVAVVVIGSIMVGGIQYALGGDNAEKVGQAKKRISTSLFAFLIFILTFAFLQWLIPGGVFN